MAGELLELLTSHDPQLRKRVTARVAQTIAASFAADRSRVTRSETTRRFRIVEKWMRQLRSEHGWAFERILDALPTILRAELDGIPWNPQFHRNSWSQ